MNQPRYQRIVDDLLKRQGEIDAPLRLPDEHTLAVEYGVSRDTIRRGLKALEEAEAIVRRPRHGTYLQPLQPEVGSVRQRTIGFVPPWWADSISAWHTSSVFAGISRWADAQGCSISVLHAQPESEPDHLWIKRVRDRKLAGLIWLSPQSQQMGLIRRMARLVPVVVVGRHEAGKDIYHVSPDYEQAVKLIDDRLVALGHESYGVISTDIMGSYSQTWIKALQKTWSRRQAAFNPSRQFLDIRPFLRPMIPGLLLDYFLPAIKPARALVLMSSSYLHPLLAHEPFRQRIGQDLSVITIDMGMHPVDAYQPGMTFDHITCNWPEVGKQAAIRLAQLIARQRVPQHLTLPVSLVRGRSCASFVSLS